MRIYALRVWALLAISLMLSMSRVSWNLGDDPW